MTTVRDIGDLPERVVIIQDTPSQDGTGQPVPSWATYKTIWARVEFMNGRELEAARKIVAEAVLRVTVRYRTDFTEKMRMRWRSIDWNIDAILPYADKHFMDFLVSKAE